MGPWGLFLSPRPPDRSGRQSIATQTPRPNGAADIVHRFNPYVHGARGLFAFMIVVFHVVNSRLPTAALLAHGWPLFLARSTEHGVELFFGVSGIVIVGALARARSPLVFALERGTRIYPVLWASIGCLVILSELTGFQGRSGPSVPVLVANLLALPPLLPGPLLHPAAWSLSYELAFYGFCALAWALRRRIGRPAVLLIAPLGVVAVGWHVRTFLMPVGMASAALLARRPGLGRRVRAPGVFLLLFLVLWEQVCEGSGGELTLMNALQIRPPLLALSMVAAVFAGLAFAGVLAGEGILSRLLASTPLQFLGTISYSLYLWHPIVMSMIKHGMYLTTLPNRVGPASQLVFFTLSFPPSVLVAWLSQQLLEKRVTAWLRRRLERLLIGRREAAAPTTAVHPTLERPVEAGGS